VIYFEADAFATLGKRRLPTANESRRQTAKQGKSKRGEVLPSATAATGAAANGVETGLLTRSK